MKITNDLATKISEVFKRWNQVKIPILIEDQEFSIHPHYFSGLLKVAKQEGIGYTNAQKTNHKPEVNISTCLGITADIGKDSRGSGNVYAGFSNLPENPDILKVELDDFMDGVVKKGTFNYISGVGEAIFSTNPDLLRPNGDSNKAIFIQNGGNKTLNLQDFDEDIIAFSKEIMAVPCVDKVIAQINLEKERSLFVNTKGSRIEQHREMAVIGFSLRGEKVNKKDFHLGTNLYFSNNGNYEKRKMERKVERLIHDAEAMRNSVRINAGSYPVIFDGAAAATFFHESLAAHLLSGKYVSDDESTIFSTERLNQQILPGYITITDDPTLENAIASYHYDEEGVQAQKVVLVENGVLRNYLLDKSSAAKLSAELGIKIYSNGRSRSEWVESNGDLLIPEPRVTNLLVESSQLIEEGEMFEGLIRTIYDSHQDYGLLVESGGGQVDVEDGVFALYPERVWRVDVHGNKDLVEGVRLVGNPDEFFNLVLATGHPYKTFYGFCGANSGGVSTQGRSPAFLLERVTAVPDRRNTETARLLERM